MNRSHSPSEEPRDEGAGEGRRSPLPSSDSSAVWRERSERAQRELAERHARESGGERKISEPLAGRRWFQVTALALALAAAVWLLLPWLA